MTSLIGQSLGRYHILEQLGEGGMATVYKAYDTRLERDVAVKVIRRGAFPPDALERILKRFEREAKALARLTHPNIIGVIDYGDHEGSPYLVMPFLPGGTLKLQMGKPIHWQEAVRLLLPIARALDFAHRKNMVHRDVKPSNILITADGEPMLTDFGIAKILDLEDTADLTGTGVGIGTPEYMSPEQGMGKLVDARADVYSLGIVLYEMVTGKKPYTANTPMAVVISHINDPLVRPTQLVPDLPDAVEKILLKALAKKAEDRYADMAGIAQAIEELLTNSSLSDVVTPASAQTEQKKIKDTQSTIAQEDSQSTRMQETTRDEASSISSMLEPSNNLPSELKKKRSWLPWVSGFGLIGLVGCSLLIGWLVGGKPAALLATDTLAPTLTSTMSLLPTNTLSAIGTIPPTEPPISEALDEIIDTKGMTMRLVPAGDFTMGGSVEIAMAECQKLYTGDTCNREWFTDEQPIQTIYLDSFYMDKYEISNANYQLCVIDDACQPPTNTSSITHSSYFGNTQFDDYPVIYVDWNMAKEYCEWRGARPPTEAEWEKAARGSEGNIYPWGNIFYETKANYCDVNCPYYWANKNFNDGYADTAPVDSFPSGVSVYGIFNLAGNVTEWTNSIYQPYPYSTSDGRENLSANGKRVLRGGAWNYYGENVRSGFRDHLDPAKSMYSIGFRCVLDIPPQD